MRLKEQNLLFFTRTMGLGGTENVVLQLCEVFKPQVNKVIVCSCGGVNEEKLSAMRIKHYTIPDIESKSPSTVLQVSKALRSIVKEESITVIHTHHRMAAFYVRMLGLNRKCRLINTSHNTFSDKRALTRMAYSRANLIACGDMVRKNLKDVYGLDKVCVIHNAVKPFDGTIVQDPVLSRARQEGKFLIGNVGRLSEQKGMEYYIRAVPDVIQRHPEAGFFILGSGEDEDKLKDMAKGLPVHFMGYRTDVQNIIGQLDLVVLSSLWEGLPLTPIEAFSMGKTIVATGVDGTLEIVKDGGNGLLVEPRDPGMIAAKINWMIEHPQQRRQMELKACETFEEAFSFERFARSYVDYYRSL